MKGSSRLKRILDIVVAALGLLCLWPLLAGIACLIAIRLGRPILFCQQRGGLHGQPFVMFKFRTMRDALDACGQPLPDPDRLTPLGLWLRRTHLDELPGLWNVLRGDMSLVGPRPLLAQYLERYTPEQQRRHQVKPGMTGWTQIQGGNALSWDEKFAHDLWYVEHQSLALDLKILWITLWQLVIPGTTRPTEPAVTPEFMGSLRDKNWQNGVQKDNNV